MKPDLSKSGDGGALSSTSITYVPDANTTLGIKASAMFAAVKDQVVQGEATFELSFTDKGGIAYAGFYGYAKFAGAIPGAENFQKAVGDKYKAILEKENELTQGSPELMKKLVEKKQHNANEAADDMVDKSKVEGQNGIMATVGIQFNFTEKSFHSTFELYVSMLNGYLKGTGANNRAGYAVMHIDPQQWYVHMGTPTDRIGLKIGIGSISIETGSYLMVGTNIPSAPGLPPQVVDMLGEDPANLDYMSGLNAIGAGKGFAFGANLSISTGDLTFLILYANYSMGMGFDLMLKDYGEMQCKGHSGAIGMDGWYANGQAYTYMHGELGVKVNLWFIKGKFPIIKADVATLMQAMLPNPSYFKAYLTARAEILGGLVKVNTRFKIEVGEVCELVMPGSSPLDMAMISDVSPSDGTSEISVFTSPQATFNMAIEKSFTVQDDSGEKTFRIKLRDFVLNDGSENIVGQLKWNAAKDVVSFLSHEILPPKKDVTATVKVVFEELKSGHWSPVLTSGKEAEEIKTVHFTTTDAPKDIPAENVLYAYPVIDQKYFLKDETTKGYIQLRQGQSYLFPADMKNQVVYENERGNKQSVDFTYSSANNRIDYTVPAVSNKTAYTLRIVTLNKDEQTSENGAASTESLLSDSEMGSIDVSKKQAVAGTRTDVGKTLLAYDFATSAYSTFRDKINNIRKKDAAAKTLSSDLLMFKYYTEEMEPFDLAELAGTDRTENKPLIALSAALDEYYFTAKINPLLYKDYPLSGAFRVSREDVDEIGVPPHRALPVIEEYLTKVENGEFTGITKTVFPYYYNLPYYYKVDLVDLQSQIVNAHIRTGNYADAYRRFAPATFPFISAGNYKIYLWYEMPGGVRGTSAVFEYYNFIE
jgi:hypothetical protein